MDIVSFKSLSLTHSLSRAVLPVWLAGATVPDILSPSPAISSALPCPALPTPPRRPAPSRGPVKKFAIFGRDGMRKRGCQDDKGPWGRAADLIVRDSYAHVQPGNGNGAHGAHGCLCHNSLHRDRDSPSYLKT